MTTTAHAQVTPGVDLEFNASLNPLNGSALWYPNIDLLPFAPTIEAPEDTSVPREYVNFGQDQSFIPVNDPSVPGITGSYSKGGTGRAWNDGTTQGAGNQDTPHGWAENINDPGEGTIGPWEQDGTFEVWFKPDGLSNGEQSILEWGGGGRGAYFSLVDDELSFFVNGTGGGTTNNALLSTTLESTGWHQMVGTYHNLQSGANDDDYISLYLNGQFVADTSATPISIERWSGGNAWGVGEIGASNNPLGTERANDGPLTLGASDAVDRIALDGEIAVVRYYNDEALTPAQVLANYQAVVGTEADFNSDGVVSIADYTVWRDNLGSTTQLANDGGLGTPVGAEHYGLWKSNFGVNGGALSSQTAISQVPEAATSTMLMFALLCVGYCYRSVASEHQNR